MVEYTFLCNFFLQHIKRKKTPINKKEARMPKKNGQTIFRFIHSKSKCRSWLVYHSPDQVQFHQTAGKRKCKKRQESLGKVLQRAILIVFGKKGAAFPVKDCTRFVCTAILHGTTNIRAKANFRLKGFEKL